jgi:hypothetical protein
MARAKEIMKAEDQPRKVYNFLKENINTPYCDGCLEKKTGIRRNHLNTITLTLSLFTNEFSRRQGVFPQCGSARDKVLTMALSA